MSVQFGRWNFDGEPTSSADFEKVEELLAPYGPDGGNSYSSAGIHMLYRAFHTTKESRLETQPYIAPSGTVITWNGCLDNREELATELKATLTNDATDVAIVAAAFDRWGTGCLARLIGDWALCVWNPKIRALILAKDPIGARHLYYAVGKNHVVWCTTLDPLLLLAEHTPALCEEYIAGWFSFFPAAHLTPYLGIFSVPPSSLVLIRPDKHNVTKYWDFDSYKETRYSTDSEYEEHFRYAFAESLRRKLRSDRPILAELSGGMDSSSIVCMADSIAAEGHYDAPRLDTVSFYDDHEPNWNERPFFTKVEEKRSRAGFHIDVSSDAGFLMDYEKNFFAATPAQGRRYTEANRRLADCLNCGGNRVILSGIGGDEILGGVPTPVPELANLIARLRILALARQLIAWSLPNRRPLFHVLAETLRSFLPPSLGIASNRRPATWLYPDFVKRHRTALQGYERRLKLFGSLPSVQENLATLDLLRRQLACSAFPSDPLYEKRFPYLDRSLLEFIYSIPREQLVRPHQRRSLMRRALAGIVPEEILNRKRKAFIARRPLTAVSENWPSFARTTEQMTTDALQIVNREAFSKALLSLLQGEEIPTVSVMRTLRLEYWVRHLQHWNLLSTPASLAPRG
jgi:asparagine synthase (glutamine-hydrolysing)